MELLTLSTESLKKMYLLILSEATGRSIPKDLRSELVSRGLRYCNGKCKGFKPLKDFHDYCISECKFCKIKKSGEQYIKRVNLEIEKRKSL